MEVNLDETSQDIADDKNVSVLAKKNIKNHVLKDEDDYKLNAGTNYQHGFEENIFNEGHTEAEVQMKINPNLLDKTKNNELHMVNKDKGTNIQKKVKESYFYTNPADALKSVSQLKKLMMNTFLIWQQFKKWESGMALCNYCEKGFPAGITTNMIKHMKVNHTTYFENFEMKQFDGNYMKGTVSEFQTQCTMQKSH